MKTIIIIGTGLVYNLLVGGVMYVAGITLIPEKSKPKFFEIVPLYPKRKYSVILYTIAAILYTLISLEGYTGVLISLLSVIIASQITRGIASFRKEELEESFEEEIERKRRTRG